MQHLRYALSYLSPALLLVATFMFATGAKADPVNLRLAGDGLLLALFALLTFPRPGHPMHALLVRAGAKIGLKPRPTPAEVTAAQDALRGVRDVNMDALNFVLTPQPHHAGWTRLDMILGPVDTPSSWIGGLPEMPDEFEWPQTDGKAALFLAQIALADLPDDIWGGIGPKTGWLVFFLAPKDWGGVRVLHVKTKGAPRDYPNGASVENYLSSSGRETMQALGQELDAFRPPKFALAPQAIDSAPEPLRKKLDARDAAWTKMMALDMMADPRLQRFASGPAPTRQTITHNALVAYQQDPEAIDFDLRGAFEEAWQFQATVEAGTIGGPVDKDFFYDAPQLPAALLRLPCSYLLGWSFGDAGMVGIFIAPEDLQAGRWDKAWFGFQD